MLHDQLLWEVANEVSLQLLQISTGIESSVVNDLYNIFQLDYLFKWLKLVLSQLSNKLQLKLMVYRTLYYKKSSDVIYLPILGGVSIHWTGLEYWTHL